MSPNRKFGFDLITEKDEAGALLNRMFTICQVKNEMPIYEQSV
jgi:hypothetical protein